MAKRIVVGSSCAAALLSVLAVAATGQSAPRTPSDSPRGTQSQTSPPTAPTGTASPTGTQSRPLGERSSSDQEITVVGCVVSESDVNGAGSSNRDRSSASGSSAREFALVDAVAPTGAGSPSPVSPGGSTAPGATGTTGSSGDAGAAAGSSGRRAVGTTGAAFMLTGDRESDLAKYVGQRVEITGKMERSSSSSRSEPSGDRDRGDRSDPDRDQPESNAPRSSASGGAASASASMPRLEIVSFKLASGLCQ